MYSPQVLEHFENPRNVGELPDADATAQVENPSCGDIMQLSLKLKRNNESTWIEDVRFRMGRLAAVINGSIAQGN